MFFQRSLLDEFLQRETDFFICVVDLETVLWQNLLIS